jgi:hypothetical protein
VSVNTHRPQNRNPHLAELALLRLEHVARQRPESDIAGATADNHVGLVRVKGNIVNDIASSRHCRELLPAAPLPDHNRVLGILAPRDEEL